jgi:hypothetical protein
VLLTDINSYILDSSDSAVTRLQTGHPGNFVSPSNRARGFAVLQNVQTKPVAYHAFSSLGTNGAVNMVIVVGLGLLISI